MVKAESRYPYIRITIRPPDPLPKGVMAQANLAVLDRWIQGRLPWVGKLKVFTEGNQTVVVGQWDQNAIAEWWANEGPADNE